VRPLFTSIIKQGDYITNKQWLVSVDSPLVTKLVPKKIRPLLKEKINFKFHSRTGKILSKGDYPEVTTFADSIRITDSQFFSSSFLYYNDAEFQRILLRHNDDGEGAVLVPENTFKLCGGRNCYEYNTPENYRGVAFCDSQTGDSLFTVFNPVDVKKMSKELQPLFCFTMAHMFSKS